MKIYETHREALHDLCKKYHVAVMYVFGSALTDKFTEDSDIDFLIKFSDVNPYDYFDNYMDLQEALEKLFLRSIDLVEVQTLKNPVLKKSINRNKVILYGREDSKMAV